MITLKDGMTTGLAMLPASAFILQFAGRSLPFLMSYRWATLLLGAIGLGMCVLSGTTDMKMSNPWTLTGAILGGASFVFIVVGLLTGSKTIFMMLAGTILVMWALTTIHHLST